MHSRAFGGVPKRSAETLGFQVALDVELAQAQNSHVGGISYDFAKAFDVIPVNIMLAVMKKRGASPLLLNALHGVYYQLNRCYRIQGSFSALWSSSNGIIQGCSLSLLGLNSLISCILEKADSIPVCLTGRAYADDISGVGSSKSKEDLILRTQNFHRVVNTYQSCGLGDISVKKTFTFGDSCLQGQVAPDFQHLNDFRLVGVSVVSQLLTGSFTKLETKRLETWKATVIKARRLPLSWPDKAKTLIATQSQATWGQGAHQLPSDQKALNLVRSALMRTFWNEDFYSMSPLLTFALLVPVQLEPTFAMLYTGLLAFQRCMVNCTQSAQTVQKILNSEVNSHVGPCARILEIIEGPLSQPTRQLVESQIGNLDLWKHDLRECWRMHLLKQLQHERSHQYARATQIDRVRTMKFHDQLQVLADGCDVPDLALTQEEAWMKIAVLRRLLAGGLLTEARIRRHKRRQDIQLCSCNSGEEATVEHVSWRCLHFHDLRQPMMDALADQIPHFPIITQYAGIFLNDSPLSQNQITLAQSTLVEIWQANIQRFYAEDLHNDPPDEPDQSSTRRQPRDANGHSLVFKEGGGVFCQKCGKYVQNLGHIKLKITKKACEFSHVQPADYITEPGKSNNRHRLERAFQELNQKYNRGNHDLEWNYKVGKKPGPEEGLLNCKACGRSWKWKDRCNNLPRTICSRNLVIASESSHSRSSVTAAKPKTKPPKFRITGKQTVRESDDEDIEAHSFSAVPNTSEPASSSARYTRFPAGIG